MKSDSSESQAHAAFHYPNFRWYMSARFLVTISSEMQSVAVAWQVYEITHRPLDLGLVGLAQFLPGIFFFLIAGHVADRIARQRILQGCYAAFSLCSLLLLFFTLRGGKLGVSDLSCSTRQWGGSRVQRPGEPGVSAVACAA